MTEPETVPSVYFSDAYGSAAAESSKAQWRTVSDSKGLWQIPLEIRHDLAPNLDAISPYGYGGIYAHPSLSANEVAYAWEESLRLLDGLGIVSVFLRFAPFLESRWQDLLLLPSLNVEHVSNTVTVCSRDADDAWKSMRGRSRTAVRKALSVGYTGRVSSAGESDFSESSPFRRLYFETMSRLNASENYVFEDAYYEKLLAGLSNRIFLAEVFDADRSVVAAALILCDDDTAHYHLSGSDPMAARNGVNNLLIWSIIKWASDRNISRVHLGGGVKPNDSLFKFKDSFGGEHTEFKVGKVIVNQNEYRKLTTARSAYLSYKESELMKLRYFPSYRAIVGSV